MKTTPFTNTFLFTVVAIILFATTVNAQEHNHTKMDSTKSEMQYHDMKTESENHTDDSLTVSKPWNAVCPVMGEEVDPEVGTVMYEGKAYGFCCKGCDKKFQKNPAKYSVNLSEDGKTFLKSE